MGALHSYLVEEVGEDYSDGIITRREALRRLGLLGLGAAAASSLIAACARQGEPPPAQPTPTQEPSRPEAKPTEAIEFAGPNGRKLMGAWAAADEAKGGVLVIHENRGLTDHIRNVAGRFATVGYSALALDLLSEEGGTASLGGDAEAMAALDKASDERFVADMRSGLGELERRLPDANLGAIGFCFGGAMVWMLIQSGDDRLVAAAPFYGTVPENPDFSKSNAAVLGVYAELDDRVNMTRDAAEAALKEAGLTHKIRTFNGADHAFFNDTGMRYNEGAAKLAWSEVLDWFGTHLA
ncbi:MAG TPA: dienelactone hydrolase family protein [Actinomycetota bacterium]|jgi:carboxymethylenebutenolidase|nr:dienelactone hydrolase family protein [Actinomycetota bacterium]